MSTQPTDKLLTAEEAANFLHVSKARLYRMAGDGTIRFIPHQQHGMKFSSLELASHLYHTATEGSQLRLPKPNPRKGKHKIAAPLIDGVDHESMTAPEAALYLNMKLDTFYWRVRHGLIPFLPPSGQRGKRFSKSELDAYQTGDTQPTMKG